MFRGYATTIAETRDEMLRSKFTIVHDERSTHGGDTARVAPRLDSVAWGNAGGKRSRCLQRVYPTCEWYSVRSTTLLFTVELHEPHIVQPEMCH